MSGFKICGDGALLPQYFPCPPRFSPFPYYPPSPPLVSDINHAHTSISTGAIVAIVILLGFVFILAALFILKFVARSAEHRAHEASRLQELQGAGHTDGLVRATTDSAGAGLEDIVVKLLPVCPYRSNKIHDCSRECAVCLSYFEEEESVRILPRCQHTFHLSCIDKWFEAHANCPLCREKITLQIIQAQAPELQPQQSSEITVVTMSEAGGEGNERPGEVQIDVGAGGEGDSEMKVADYCEVLIESERADALKGDLSRSAGRGVGSVRGWRCEDCRTKQEARCPDEFWGTSSMTSIAHLRRSFSTGSMKRETSSGDRHNQLMQDPCCSRPALYLINDGL